VKSLYDGDIKMWQNIFTQKIDSHFPAAPGGIVLPHHMIVANEISKTYQKLAEVSHPSLIVIISPNHYEDGQSLIQTCSSCEYQTTEGNTIIDTSLAKKLTQNNIATDEPKTFIKEHGVFNHAPFIKHFFPEAKMLPILIKWEAPSEKTVELSNWLDANIPKDALVIASVDFSHYVPVEHANFHDISSYATIKNFDYQNMYDLEIDSPPSISTITHLMEKRGYMSAERFTHTNNQQFQPEPIPETTSHQFIGFFKGEKRPEKSLTIMSFGNMSPDQRKNDDGSQLGLYDNYRWNIDWPDGVTESKAINFNKWLRDFRGKEDRMLMGADFLVFNLPDFCTQKAQNGINITFCKIRTSSAGYEKDLKNWTTFFQKQSQKNNTTFYVSIDDSRNYQLSAWQWTNLSHQIANLRRSIIIGTGTNTSTPIEHYKGSLLIQSLGNFTTSPDIKKSFGKIAEIIITPGEIKAEIYKVDILNGYPQLPFKSSNKNQNIKPLQKG